MGACNFNIVKIGKFETAGTAYRQAKEEAEYESGHDGYNGTISTCNNLVIEKNAPRYNTKNFWDWVNKKQESLNKRECVAVEITGTQFNNLKLNEGLHGKRGIKAFYLFGLAAE